MGRKWKTSKQQFKEKKAIRSIRRQNGFKRLTLDLLFSTGGFPGGSVVKNPPASAGNMGSIPGSGRSPGGGNGIPLQYSCLENSMDRRGTDTPVHRPEKTTGYSYSSTSVCHPVNNSRGKRRSIPAHKTRPDSPLPTMQGAAIGIRNGEEP